MENNAWQKSVLPPMNNDLLWELFHENSKVSRYDGALTNEEILKRMNELHESLPYFGYPIVDLPRTLPPLKDALDEILTARMSIRELIPSSLSLPVLAALLHYAYGETRDNRGTGYPRPFRVVPSGGGLYPLEIYCYSNCIDGEVGGIYHYNPSKHNLRLLSPGEKTESIAQAMVYPEIIKGASLLIFITAVFERSVFKYADRGYRFILLEAGHVAQNINHVATALGLGCVNIGGFYDREVDDVLGLDGVTHSTIYMAAVGKKNGEAQGKDGATSITKE